MANPFPWINLNPSVLRRWDGRNEYGTDIAMPVGTKITSPVEGHVVGNGYFAWGGVVTVRGVVEGVMTDVYFQHLDLNAVSKGDHINIGDLVGWSGGQLSGGHHPVHNTPTKIYSTGPHIEVGFNYPGGGLAYGGSHPSGNRDSYGWLQDAASGKLTSGKFATNPDNLPNEPSGLGGTFGDITSNIKGLGPNDDVTSVFVDIDKYLEIYNPFIVTPDEYDHISILGATVDVVDPGKWLNGVLTNIIIMLVAIILRPILILIGVFVIIKLIFTFIDSQAATETGFQAARLATVLS